MSKLHSLVVEEIQSLTPNSVAVRFGLPPEFADDFSFQAGQYLTLEASIDETVVRRAYSLCSAPVENRLTVGIKKVPAGVFSSFANDTLKVGDVLGVAPPTGRFVFSPSSAKENLLLVAAGSGITPIFSILKQTLETAPQTAIHLVYGNKTPEETMFKSQLEAMERSAGGQFKIHWMYSQRNEDNALFGRIDKAAVRYALNQMREGAKKAFLCGPEGMIDVAKKTLLETGLEEEAIFYELFHSKSDASAPVEDSKSIELTIVSDDETHHLSSSKTQTILDAALNEKIDVPYSCQGGVCCSCIAKITAGEVKMENNQILTDDEINDGLVLTCISHPVSSQITVNYDDV